MVPSIFPTRAKRSKCFYFVFVAGAWKIYSYTERKICLISWFKIGLALFSTELQFRLQENWAIKKSARENYEAKNQQSTTVNIIVFIILWKKNQTYPERHSLI